MDLLEDVEVLSGIPQGSVLGPLLFIIYINGIVDACGNGVIIFLFADDAKIYKYINNTRDTEVLQHGILTDLLNGLNDGWSE